MSDDLGLDAFRRTVTRGIVEREAGSRQAWQVWESCGDLRPFPKRPEAGPKSASRQRGFRLCKPRVAVCSIVHDDQRCESVVCHILNAEAVITC
jgi:hypothetical protein